MNLLWKGILLGSILVLALFFNYPSLMLIMPDKSRQVENMLEKKKKTIDLQMSELRGLNLALKDTRPDRIRILMEPSKDVFPFENIVIKKILDQKFILEEEKGDIFLKLTSRNTDVFLSDYLDALNRLFDNVRKITDVSLATNGKAIVFTVLDGRRISSESEPVKTIVGNSFSWFHIAADVNRYELRPGDNEYTVNLGLDLKGGMYLDVGVDTNQIYDSILARLLFDLEEVLIEQKIDFEEVIVTDRQSLLVVLSKYEDVDLSSPPYERYLRDFVIEKNESGYEILFDEENKIEISENAFEQIIDTINNRINSLGVKEPSIQRKGLSSVIIQLPGQDDPGRAKSLLTKPASLEFRFVLDNATPANPGTGVILNEEILDPVSKEVLVSIPTVVENKVAMRGDVVRDARLVFGQSGLPEVGLSLNAAGTSRFTELTSKNVGRRLAIILDNKIQSTPVIQSVIFGGEASITGNFTVNEARDLAIVLRSGALPAPLIINEERTVGASLGATSVRNSLIALFAGFLTVICFIVIYYRVSGLFSVLSLLFNILLIVAVLVYFGAVLTLPGIAGIILTIGMAIDANVLIFERIREELRRGTAVRKAVKIGFSRATSTILDANITTIIAAIVLFQFGTGPIKGFAVTLSIGIIASMFTSIVVTRFLFELFYLQQKNLVKISI